MIWLLKVQPQILSVYVMDIYGEILTPTLGEDEFLASLSVSVTPR